ncbi:TIGR01548 family HAD-type hydrolase [Spirulina major CS-329]|uniref:TIGR01548 family HAD-type hydrolase n=1 Tax=Spirulina TaxID=1154 RepID=UPI00232E84AA|nr:MULTISPECIES: TIGR01548 family HAD-type hydrolase [Spirulina]MDB9495860.1 TIGR01548 family HAD-type hydrolase [Spirulina subsalsa CS-330]MDB9504672.1 TIGR01548 family HAD-type hydrolase [Spirulina major CS-329]
MIIFDIDGVIRDVTQSYRRAIADTVEHYTEGNFRPTLHDIDQLKSEGVWNNDWEASQELIYRYYEKGHHASDGGCCDRTTHPLDYAALVDFFQARYRGNHWDGYITSEPLLVTAAYFQTLTAAQIPWGFFSGAMRDEALYALSDRLGLDHPPLFAMEDGPGKPDPTGLLTVMDHLAPNSTQPVCYVGDTVGDLQTVQQAQAQRPDHPFIGIGILPPHVQPDPHRCEAYRNTLKTHGAACVLANVMDLTPERYHLLLESS